MKTVTIHEAKTHLSRLIREVLTGEEIIIGKGKEPLVKIIPLEGTGSKRESGCAEGIVEYMAEDFNAPLTDFDEYMK